MSNTRRNTIHLRFYLAYCICALLVYVLLMAFALPWWHVSNHPVTVNIGAGSAQKMGIEFSAGEDPMMLVPVGEQKGFHSKWATELPPRPSYDLKLVFPEGTQGEVVFKLFELVQLTPERQSIYLNFIDIPVSDKPGIRLRKLGDGVRIHAEPGGTLDLDIEIVPPSAYTWLQSWARASFGYLILSIVFLFLLSAFLQFPDKVQAYRKKTSVLEIVLLLVFAVAGSLVHMHLLNHSMPAFSPGESDNHVIRAIQMDKGDAVEADVSLRPGYSYFLSMVAGAADWDMNAVIMVQGILFCIALTLTGLATVRLINAWFLGPVIILAFMSPAAIWASRHIGVESLTASLWLFALAAFLLQWQNNKWKKWLGFVLFGLVVIPAVCVTSSGLLMLLLPLGLMVGTFVWSVSIRRSTFWKLEVFWRTFGQVSIPFAMLVMFSLIVAVTQSQSWNLFSLAADSSQPSFSSGIFEVTAIMDDEEYASIINKRVESDFTSDWAKLTGSPSRLNEINEKLPIQAKWISRGHLAYWGLLIPDIEVSPGKSLRKDYTVRNNFANAAEARGVQDSIATIMRKTGQAVFVMEKRSNRQVVVYNQIFIGIYRWFYRILFFTALIAWLIGLADRKQLAGLFVLSYMLNILLHVFSLNPGSEIIQSMDSLLWIGALAGMLAANSKSLQKPTDETDRRTMRPIRPKRLLTRHATIPGLPRD